MLKTLLILLLAPISFLFGQPEEKPCPRNQPVTAYHTAENAIFLFGGYCSAEKRRLNDFWKFDGDKWIAIQSENAPEPRSGHSMVYDASRKSLIVFGGKNDQGEVLNDLWSWDGTSWVLLSDEGPEARQSHRMVTNSNNGDLFLFGGSNASRQSFSDTWVYRDGKWKELNTEESPPPRLQHTMVYDQQRNKVILFGGFDRTDDGKVIYGDTWEWSTPDGWTLKDNNEKMARDHHAMAYDVASETTILFGGYNQGYLGDTWSWNGEAWTLRAAEGPARAGKPALMYHHSEQSLVLFGGGNSDSMQLMDFWQFNGQRNAWEHYPMEE